jgi:Zn finger protein HypA/HybF involved in hydrogenase expression
MSYEKEKIECKKCGWKGNIGQVHCDRGGHNFLCPKCKALVA